MFCASMSTTSASSVCQKTVGAGERIRSGGGSLLSHGQLSGETPARTGRHHYFGSFTSDVKRNRNRPRSQSMMTMEATEKRCRRRKSSLAIRPTRTRESLTGDKQVIKTGMCKEDERCMAIEPAQGRT